jgi:hypothetical protein
MQNNGQDLRRPDEKVACTIKQFKSIVAKALLCSGLVILVLHMASFLPHYLQFSMTFASFATMCSQGMKWKNFFGLRTDRKEEETMEIQLTKENHKIPWPWPNDTNSGWYTPGAYPATPPPQ